MLKIYSRILVYVLIIIISCFSMLSADDDERGNSFVTSKFYNLKAINSEDLKNIRAFVEYTQNSGNLFRGEETLFALANKSDFVYLVTEEEVLFVSSENSQFRKEINALKQQGRNIFPAMQMANNGTFYSAIKRNKLSLFTLDKPVKSYMEARKDKQASPSDKFRQGKAESISDGFIRFLPSQASLFYATGNKMKMDICEEKALAIVSYKEDCLKKLKGFYNGEYLTISVDNLELRRRKIEEKKEELGVAPLSRGEAKIPDEKLLALALAPNGNLAEVKVFTYENKEVAEGQLKVIKDDNYGASVVQDDNSVAVIILYKQELLPEIIRIRKSNQKSTARKIGRQIRQSTGEAPKGILIKK